MSKIIRNFIIAQVVTALIMFTYFKELTLLSYINSAFVVGGTIMFLGLVSFVFSTGFFDVFTVTMRKVITPKSRMEDVMSMRTPSEIFSAPVSPLLGSGALVLMVMGIALVIFYL
ncbi:DUF3899 domain-containing protein [Sporosarcina sp. YIM B06819]|uniref:DUF3899 domain-containing protein n=1 Tax=Sporosarcina sp. YIM B06819 TaxID=3081769 RepID=UPI00298C5AB7|nr:DUF3899 domain-containing protein [Sporosarcina sp. YIM B06819]